MATPQEPTERVTDDQATEALQQVMARADGSEEQAEEVATEQPVEQAAEAEPAAQPAEAAEAQPTETDDLESLKTRLKNLEEEGTKERERSGTLRAMYLSSRGPSCSTCSSITRSIT